MYLSQVVKVSVATMVIVVGAMKLGLFPTPPVQEPVFDLPTAAVSNTFVYSTPTLRAGSTPIYAQQAPAAPVQQQQPVVVPTEVPTEVIYVQEVIVPTQGIPVGIDARQKGPIDPHEANRLSATYPTATGFVLPTHDQLQQDMAGQWWCVANSPKGVREIKGPAPDQDGARQFCERIKAGEWDK